MPGNDHQQGTPPAVPVLYFGKYKGQSLRDVPRDYLAWALANVKLSYGLRVAVRAELLARGVDPARLPPEPEARPPRCRHCGCTDARRYWHELSGGGRAVRADCRRCRRLVGFLPQSPGNVAAADAAQPPAGLLDALTLASDQGVELVRHGATLTLEPAGRATAELERLVRQNAHLLRSLVRQCPCGRYGP
jgi:antitoxin component of MazEF toxin-antitoxin module